MSEPHVAATVMIARDSNGGPEFFMLRRGSSSAFMPDVFVFPGGRVDEQDGSSEARERLHGASAGLDAACVYGAARETFEECGLLFATDSLDPHDLAHARTRLLARTSTLAHLLRDLDTRIDAGALHYFSRWITPRSEPRRFDTHFFVARAPANQVAQADAAETHDGVWITAREALARSAAGAFALVFPTVKHLQRVSEFASTAALLAFAAEKSIHTVVPHVDAQQVPSIAAAIEGIW